MNAEGVSLPGIANHSKTRRAGCNPTSTTAATAGRTIRADPLAAVVFCDLVGGARQAGEAGDSSADINFRFVLYGGLDHQCCSRTWHGLLKP